MCRKTAQWVTYEKTVSTYRARILLKLNARADGRMLNRELVREGACWWYQKYAPGDTVLEGLEKYAREERKGLWADPQPVPPWEWRKRK